MQVSLFLFHYTITRTTKLTSFVEVFEKSILVIGNANTSYIDIQSHFLLVRLIIQPALDEIKRYKCLKYTLTNIEEFRRTGV